MRRLLLPLLILPLAGWESWGTLNNFTYSQPNSPSWVKKEIRLLSNQADNLNPRALEAGLQAYVKARHMGLDNKGLLTIIDYSKPSTARRLWVIDVKHNRVLFNTWVAHGRNSGNITATNFSNQSGSKKSSIGVFLTAETYMGGNGYSLRMKGLEPGINDHAYQRDIVFHGAWYVQSNVAQKYGQIGRSWGCPAVNPKIAKPLIDTIRNNTLVLAWYPDAKWLRHSNWVNV